jgi:hypothetical protein
LRKKRQREAVFNLTGQGYLHIASSLREERSDEAIQRHLAQELDCFAEPVIGRAFTRPVGSQ